MDIGGVCWCGGKHADSVPVAAMKRRNKDLCILFFGMLVGGLLTLLGIVAR